MPNWTIIRLREKAKGNRSEGLFRRIESRAAADPRKAETVEEFLARGGNIVNVSKTKPERGESYEMP